ncbi:hypothetical protein [Carp edema virus]|nr:hypothetical protein [Carp edema virus]
MASNNKYEYVFPQAKSMEEMSSDEHIDEIVKMLSQVSFYPRNVTLKSVVEQGFTVPLLAHSPGSFREIEIVEMKTGLYYSVLCVKSLVGIKIGTKLVTHQKKFTVQMHYKTDLIKVESSTKIYNIKTFSFGKETLSFSRGNLTEVKMEMPKVICQKVLEREESSTSFYSDDISCNAGSCPSEKIEFCDYFNWAVPFLKNEPIYFDASEKTKISQFCIGDQKFEIHFGEDQMYHIVPKEITDWDLQYCTTIDSQAAIDRYKKIVDEFENEMSRRAFAKD